MAEQLAFNEDCLEAMRRMEDKCFDLAVVDPPYGGVGQGGYMTNKSSGGVADHPSYHTALWKQDKPKPEYFKELFRVSKNQVIWGGNYFQTLILQDTQCWIVWDKQKGDGVAFADFEIAWTSFDRASRMFRYMWNGMLQGDMKNKEAKIHPTQKPVALYVWIYNTFAKPGERILDTHLGSGSSRIAAHDLGLDFVGYEIDETYFQLQEERFRRHTAQVNLFLL